MKQILENLNYKRISLVLLILVILAIIPHFCNNTDRLQGQYDILKKQLSEQKQIVKKTKKKLTLFFIHDTIIFGRLNNLFMPGWRNR